MSRVFLSVAVWTTLILMTGRAEATIITPRGTASLQANGTTKIDVTDPENDNVVNTAEWSISTSGGGSTGTFNGPGNNGEMWTKVFDNAVTTQNWGTGTSKVCCGGLPAIVEMKSTIPIYDFTGYTLTLSNDSPSRDPVAWTFEGWNGLSWVVIDTETAQFTSDPGRLFTTEYTLDHRTGPFSGFRFVFTANRPGNQSEFAIQEIEVFGVVPEPSTLLMFSLGGAGLAACVWRRRRLRKPRSRPIPPAGREPRGETAGPVLDAVPQG
jgi:hypothetical protein